MATPAIASWPSSGTACVRRCATTCSTASSMPRRSAIGSAPAATLRSPWRTIACASTVAVVVPSPATSLVSRATSFTSRAPWRSNSSASSISPAIVTPSLVTMTSPVPSASMTLRPLGPSVTFTASATASMPASSEARASVL